MTATVRGVSVEGRGGSVNNEAIHEYTVVYKVGTDNRSDGPSIVEQANGIPNIGDVYSVGNDFDAYAYCSNKSVSQGDSPWEWEVTCTFTNQPLSLVGSSPAPNPLNDPAEITYGFQSRRILVPGTYNDPASPPSSLNFESGIYAPNGELFSPQPEADWNEPVVTVKKNVQSVSFRGLMDLANCVNSDWLQGAEPRQLKLGAPQATRKYHAACGYYWEVSYTLAFKWDTWDIQLLNQGSYYYAGGAPAAVWSSTALRKVKTDEQGTPILINLTTAGDINTGNTPTFTVIRFYRELAFNSLGLI